MPIKRNPARPQLLVPADARHGGLAIQPGTLLLSATTDAGAVASWLAKVDAVGSDKTLDAYRKESRRLLAWLEWRGLTLATFGVEAAAAYVKFLENPQPAKHWVGPRRPLDHPEWKPFLGPLAPASVRQARLVLGSLFTFLSSSGYIAGNAFRLLGRVNLPTRRVHEMALYASERLAVEALIESMPKETARERLHYHRCRWVFYLLILTGLRRAEAANARMEDVQLRHIQIEGSPNADTGAGAAMEEHWTLKVTGKGNKVRDVPLPDQLVDELRLYRKSQGYPEDPAVLVKSPLIRPVTTTHRNLSEKAVYLLVRQIFENAAFAALDKGDAALAARLNQVSTHWLRHTSATLQIESDTALEMVQDNLGHSTIQTTRLYVHVDPARRYRAARGLKV